MLEQVAQIDQQLFFFINSTLANPFTDAIMPVVTSDFWLRIGYGVALALCLWKGDARLRWIVLFSLITLTVADQTSSKFLKPLIERPRPCHTLETLHLLVGCGGGWSMPSSHAANSFAQAGLFAVLTPSTRKWLLPIATLIALSRVFVGVHYPFDVLAGAVLGALIGYLVANLFRLFVMQGWLPKLESRKSATEDDA
jgi:undecaprenyl-diphosphatase